MINITFPDGSVRQFNEGVTGYEIAQSISQRLAQDVLACSVNDEIIELNRPKVQSTYYHQLPPQVRPLWR